MGKDTSRKQNSVLEEAVYLPPPFVHHHFESIESTQDEAKFQLEQSKQDWPVVTAATQTMGRGRQGRNWISPVGNVYCSFAIVPEKAMSFWPEISFLMACSLRRSFDGFLTEEEAKKLRVQLKWPNDLLLNDQKVAGILLETFTLDNAEAALVIGFGVNLTSSPVDTPYPATNLQKYTEGKAPSPLQFVTSVISSFADLYKAWQKDGFEPILEEWLQNSWRIGQEIRVSDEKGQKISGIFKGVAPSGALILLRADGTERKILAGDVLF